MLQYLSSTYGNGSVCRTMCRKCDLNKQGDVILSPFVVSQLCQVPALPSWAKISGKTHNYELIKPDNLTRTTKPSPERIIPSVPTFFCSSSSSSSSADPSITQAVSPACGPLYPSCRATKKKFQAFKHVGAKRKNLKNSDSTKGSMLIASSTNKSALSHLESPAISAAEIPGNELRTQNRESNHTQRSAIKRKKLKRKKKSASKV